MTDFLQNCLILAGRILMSALFLWAGFAKIFRWKGTVDYMDTKRVPTSLLPAVIVLQLLGGFSVLLGYHIRIGAILLIVFLIPAMLRAHNFWAYPEPERTTEKIHFMTNLGILGGLLWILAWGAGGFALS